MSISITALKYARTGVAWTSGAYSLVPTGTAQTGVNDYLVTDISIDNTGFDILGQSYQSSGIYLSDCSKPSELWDRCSYYDDGTGIAYDYRSGGTIYFWCDAYATYVDGSGFLYGNYYDAMNAEIADRWIEVYWVYGCFVAGTLVSTIKGNIPIELIKVGDTVFSYDEKSGLLVPSIVKKIFHHERRKNFLIKINERVVATYWHPFLRDGGWVKAKDLRVGDSIMSMEGPCIIHSLDKYTQEIPVYNLAVEGDNHNYLANGLVAHNKCPFLYGVDEDGTEELLNTFIYMQDSKDKDHVQKRDTPTKKIYKSYLIKEIDDETSYIEFICLLVTDVTGKIHMLRCTNPKLRDIDGQYVCTEVGDVLPVDFRKYTGDEIVSVEILAKGYYIPN